MARKVIRISELSQIAIDKVKEYFLEGCGMQIKDSQIIETALKKYAEAMQKKNAKNKKKQLDLTL